MGNFTVQMSDGSTKNITAQSFHEDDGSGDLVYVDGNGKESDRIKRGDWAHAKEVSQDTNPLRIGPNVATPADGRITGLAAMVPTSPSDPVHPTAAPVSEKDQKKAEAKQA